MLLNTSHQNAPERQLDCAVGQGRVGPDVDGAIGTQVACPPGAARVPQPVQDALASAGALSGPERILPHEGAAASGTEPALRSGLDIYLATRPERGSPPAAPGGLIGVDQPRSYRAVLQSRPEGSGTQRPLRPGEQRSAAGQQRCRALEAAYEQWRPVPEPRDFAEQARLAGLEPIALVGAGLPCWLRVLLHFAYERFGEETLARLEAAMDILGPQVRGPNAVVRHLPAEHMAVMLDELGLELTFAVLMPRRPPDDGVVMTHELAVLYRRRRSDGRTPVCVLGADFDTGYGHYWVTARARPTGAAPQPFTRRYTAAVAERVIFHRAMRDHYATQRRPDGVPGLPDRRPEVAPVENGEGEVCTICGYMSGVAPGCAVGHGQHRDCTDELTWAHMNGDQPEFCLACHPRQQNQGSRRVLEPDEAVDMCLPFLPPEAAIAAAANRRQMRIVEQRSTAAPNGVDRLIATALAVPLCPDVSAGPFAASCEAAQRPPAEMARPSQIQTPPVGGLPPPLLNEIWQRPDAIIVTGTYLYEFPNHHQCLVMGGVAQRNTRMQYPGPTCQCALGGLFAFLPCQHVRRAFQNGQPVLIHGWHVQWARRLQALPLEVFWWFERHFHAPAARGESGVWHMSPFNGIPAVREGSIMTVERRDPLALARREEPEALHPYPEVIAYDGLFGKLPVEWRNLGPHWRLFRPRLRFHDWLAGVMQEMRPDSRTCLRVAGYAGLGLLAALCVRKLPSMIEAQARANVLGRVEAVVNRGLCWVGRALKGWLPKVPVFASRFEQAQRHVRPMLQHIGLSAPATDPAWAGYLNVGALQGGTFRSASVSVSTTTKLTQAVANCPRPSSFESFARAQTFGRMYEWGVDKWDARPLTYTLVCGAFRFALATSVPFLAVGSTLVKLARVIFGQEFKVEVPRARPEDLIDFGDGGTQRALAAEVTNRLVLRGTFQTDLAAAVVTSVAARMEWPAVDGPLGAITQAELARFGNTVYGSPAIHQVVGAGIGPLCQSCGHQLSRQRPNYHLCEVCLRVAQQRPGIRGQADPDEPRYECIMNDALPVTEQAPLLPLKAKYRPPPQVEQRKEWASVKTTYSERIHAAEIRRQNEIRRGCLPGVGHPSHLPTVFQRGPESMFNGLKTRTYRQVPLRKHWVADVLRRVRDEIMAHVPSGVVEEMDKQEWFACQRREMEMREADRQLEAEGFTEEDKVCKPFVKTEWQKKGEKPRIIYSLSDKTQVKVGRWTHPLMEFFREHLGARQLIQYCGCNTPSDNRRVLREIEEAVQGGAQIFMNDFTCFETTQDRSTMAVVRELYRRVWARDDPVREQCMDWWERPKFKAQSGGHRFSGWLPEMMCSGRSDTAITNSLLNAIATAAAHAAARLGIDVERLVLCPSGVIGRALDGFRMYFVGDDSIVTGMTNEYRGQAKYKERVEKAYSDLAFCCKLEQKQHVRDIVFLGCRPYNVRAGDGTRQWEWGPTLGRRLFKHHWCLEGVGDPRAWLGEVVQMEAKCYGHVPILGTMARRCLHLLGPKRMANRKVQQRMAERWQWIMKLESCGTADYETMEHLAQVYGLEPAALIQLDQQIAAIPSLPYLLSSPTIDRIMDFDN